MELSRETVAGVIGAVIAVLLQITVAPAITLFEAVPNFIVAFCIVRAVATPAASGSVMPLVLGLLFDLMGGGPVGGMAFVLVLVTFLASRLFMALNNDTLFMPVAIMLACIMLVEVMYGLIVVVCGADVPLGEAFLYRTLPCMLYDCVIGLLLYPIAARPTRDAGPSLGRGSRARSYHRRRPGGGHRHCSRGSGARAARPQGDALGRPRQGSLGAFHRGRGKLALRAPLQGPGRPRGRCDRVQLRARGRVEEAL